MALQISNLATDDVERLRHFASESLGHVTGMTRARIEARWLDEVEQLLQDETTLGIAVENAGALRGFAISTPLPWESGLLGKSMWVSKFLKVDSGSADAEVVARKLIGALNDLLLGRGGEFLLCKPDAAETMLVHGLEANGFLLMDTLLDFLYDCRKVEPTALQPEVRDGFVLRLATPQDVEPLVETARAAFAGHFGRFHADPRIEAEAATSIYEEWIRSCANGWADWVYVLSNDERIAAYSAWKRPSALDQQHQFRLGHYSIGAVHPDFLGRGFFKAVTSIGMATLCQEVDWIEGPTHLSNRAVQQAYLRLGWKSAGARHSFHKWLKN